MTRTSTSPSSSAEPRPLARRLGRARVWCSDRHGGVSQGPFATLNLAHGSGDRRAAVQENRRRLAAATTGGPPGRWAWLRQVHGARIAPIAGHGGNPAGPAPVADAAVTTAPGRPLVVLVADCAPLALVAGGAVGVVHAGWRGLLAGVVEDAARAVRDEGRAPVAALLGPCIHPAHYTFGADALGPLVARFGAAVAAVDEAGRPALDLPAAVRAALERAGVDDVVDVGIDTASSPDHFSHRRDGTTGRQALVAVLEPA